MAIPISYTELSFAQFMKDVLDATASAIDWLTVPGKYQEAVNESILAYGVDDISQCTDIQKLRAIGRREVWRAVADATAGNYRFGSDREIYFRNQIHEHAVSQYARYSQEAAKYVTDDDSVRASNMIVIDEFDPYVYVEEQELSGVE